MYIRNPKYVVLVLNAQIVVDQSVIFKNVLV